MCGVDCPPTKVDDALFQQHYGGKPPCKFKYVRFSQQIRRRVLHQLTPVHNGVHYAVHNPGIDTLVRGIYERGFFVDYGRGFERPIPFIATHQEMKPLRRFRDLCTAHIGPLDPLTPEQFLATYQDQPRLKRVYTEAQESLRREGLLEEDGDLTLFSKSEKLNFTEKADPAPRVIFPRGTKYNACFGRYTKRCEHAIFDAINHVFGYTVVCKGLNALDRGRAIQEVWVSFKNPVAISIDAKRFDQHTRRQMLMFEWSWYLALFGRSDELYWLRSRQLVNRCRFRTYNGKGSCTFDGNRASGDMNTGLGNIIIVCSMLWALRERLSGVVKFIDDGDDCIVFCEESDYQLVSGCITNHFRPYGYHFEVDAEARVIEKVEFCQCQPIERSPGEYVMVRDPTKTLSKDALSTKFIGSRSYYDKLRCAIADGGRALTSGIPVVYEFYCHLGRGAGTTKAQLERNGFWYLQQGMVDDRHCVHDCARASFYSAFGISPAEQEATEHALRHVTVEYGAEPNFALSAVLRGMWSDRPFACIAPQTQAF